MSLTIFFFLLFTGLSTGSTAVGGPVQSNGNIVVPVLQVFLDVALDGASVILHLDILGSCLALPAPVCCVKQQVVASSSFDCMFVASGIQHVHLACFRFDQVVSVLITFVEDGSSVKLALLTR